MGLARKSNVNIPLSIILVLVIVLSLTVGAVSVPLERFSSTIQEVLTNPQSTWSFDTVILWRLRFPRVLLAAAVGAALATAGAVLQGLLRNGMADSYVLGVSSGASLGAALVMSFGLRMTFLGLGSVASAAFLGATLTLILVMTIARRLAGNSTLGLLLVGIAMSSFLSAIVSMLVYFSRERIQPIVFWIMGGFAGRGWNHLMLVVPYLVVGYGLAYSMNKYLTAISLGDKTAHHLGINVERARLILLSSSALLTAAAVSVSGVIGFVGLMIPHVGRLLSPHSYKQLLPTSALIGAIFLTLADLLARTVVRPGELPVGIITALCGGPFFLYLLARQHRGV